MLIPLQQIYDTIFIIISNNKNKETENKKGQKEINLKKQNKNK